MVGDGGRKGVVSTMGGMDVSLLFRRIVATREGRETLELSPAIQSQVVDVLMGQGPLRTLVLAYHKGLCSPETFGEADEIALRQQIFPQIDAELRRIDPRYQVFSVGILELMIQKIDQKG